MLVGDQILETSPERFIEEDLSSQNSKALFIKRRPSAQIAKLKTFFLGHNTECFAPEPVYGPTGKGFLISRGVEGLEHDKGVLEFFATEAGIEFIENFRQKVVSQIGHSKSTCF